MKNMIFEFTQDCITGINLIDDEHRNLFALLSKAYTLACTEYHSDYYQEVKNILEELDNYAETHFTHEEEYMMQIRDPELIRQRTQHTFSAIKFVSTNLSILTMKKNSNVYLLNLYASSPNGCTITFLAVIL